MDETPTTGETPPQQSTRSSRASVNILHTLDGRDPFIHGAHVDDLESLVVELIEQGGLPYAHRVIGGGVTAMRHAHAAMMAGNPTAEPEKARESWPMGTRLVVAQDGGHHAGRGVVVCRDAGPYVCVGLGPDINTALGHVSIDATRLRPVASLHPHTGVDRALARLMDRVRPEDIERWLLEAVEHVGPGFVEIGGHLVTQAQWDAVKVAVHGTSAPTLDAVHDAEALTSDAPVFVEDDPLIHWATQAWLNLRDIQRNGPLTDEITGVVGDFLEQAPGQVKALAETTIGLAANPIDLNEVGKAPVWPRVGDMVRILDDTVHDGALGIKGAVAKVDGKTGGDDVPGWVRFNINGTAYQLSGDRVERVTYVNDTKQWVATDDLSKPVHDVSPGAFIEAVEGPETVTAPDGSTVVEAGLLTLPPEMQPRASGGFVSGPTPLVVGVGDIDCVPLARLRRTHPMLRYFDTSHLPDDLKVFSEGFALLADFLVDNLPAIPETTVALRHLLEAKDAAVRSALDLREDDQS